jgi:methionine salvage enolase-phosphatase E1
VHETLFPYAKDNLGSYLTTNWESNSVKEDVVALRDRVRQWFEEWNHYNVDCGVEMMVYGCRRCKTSKMGLIQLI